MENINWTPSFAYVIGLLVTDGNLSKDGRHIIFRSSDKQQVETFKKILALKNKISQTYNNGYAKKPTYRIQFSNVRLYRWLLNQGIFPAKTYTIAKINIPDNYFRDFIRGHLDGDGTIVIYEDRYNSYKGKVYMNQRVFTKLISVSYIHLDWLQEKILKLANIKGALICNLRKNKATMWELKYSKRASEQLFKWIYYNPTVPCLTRKRILEQKALNLIKY